MSTRDTDALERSDQFQQMPEHIKRWILLSPHASQNFAEFFDKGGKIETEVGATLPRYRPSDPPAIVVDQENWRNLQQPGAFPWSQRHMFAMLAHEIGHDRDNTTRPFKPDGTAQEYVQYRSEIEATAIFNAFPILRDLKNEPEFKKESPFDAIGYLNGLELARLYQQWNSGELEDKQVVAAIAGKVADTRYTLGGSLTDQDCNGVLTHRDAYLHDFERVLRPRTDAQPPGQAGDNEPAQPQRSNHGGATENTFLRNTREKTLEAFAQHGLSPSDQALDCIAGSLCAQARRDGLERIDHVLLSQHPGGEIGRNVIAVEGRLDDPGHKLSHVNAQTAANVSLGESMRNLASLEVTQRQQPSQQAETVDRPLQR